MSLDPPLPASHPRRRAPVPTPIEEPAAAYRLLAMLGLIVTWGLLMQRFGRQGSIYAVMGPFALAVSLAVLALFGRTLRGSLRPTRAAVLGGLAVGVSMTLATYPVYAVLRRLMPGLERDVTVLYAAARQTTLSQALPWVLAIIVAEELLWRGALLCALERRVPPAAALVISIATYAAAQLGTGSWIVMLLALVCGTIWTLQRHFTRSLLSPLLAHLVWTPTVILFYPVAASDDGRAEPVSHTPRIDQERRGGWRRAPIRGRCVCRSASISGTGTLAGGTAGGARASSARRSAIYWINASMSSIAASIMHPSLRELSHRPWPLPQRPWKWRQSWRDLAFLHWPIAASTLRPLVPASLELQEFDGTSWVGVVPFRMAGVMRRPFPDVPGVSAFPELNVRLYVERDGKPGVWFLSLDAESPLAVWAARRFFHLPYHLAGMSVDERAGAIRYRSRRPGAEFKAKYRPVSDVYRAEPGTLDHWLSERYCLYALAPDGSLWRNDVHHAPWPLQSAEVSIQTNTMLEVHGLDVTGPPALSHFARRLDVVVWSAECVAGA